MVRSVFFVTFKCIFFWKILHSSSWKILKNVNFFEHLEKFRSQTTEITPETCKKVKRNRKIAKFSACGGPNKAKEHQNIQSKFNQQKNLHSSKTNKKTLLSLLFVGCVALGAKSMTNPRLACLFWSFFKITFRIALTIPNSDLSASFTITDAQNTVIRVLNRFSNFMAGRFTFAGILRFVHVEKSLRSLIEMTIRLWKPSNSRRKYPNKSPVKGI